METEDHNHQVGDIIEQYLRRPNLAGVPLLKQAFDLGGAIPKVVHKPVPSHFRQPVREEKLSAAFRNINFQQRVDDMSKEERNVLVCVGVYLHILHELKDESEYSAASISSCLKDFVSTDNRQLDEGQIFDSIIQATIAEEMEILHQVLTIIGHPLGVKCREIEPDYFKLSPANEEYWYGEALQLIKKKGWYSFLMHDLIPTKVKYDQSKYLRSKLAFALVFTICRIRQIFLMTSSFLQPLVQSNPFFHHLLKDHLPHQLFILNNLSNHIYPHGEHEESSVDTDRVTVYMSPNDHNRLKDLTRMFRTGFFRIERAWEIEG